VDIKATIGQLAAERDKLDKAIQALQALENASDLAHRRTGPRTTRGPRTRPTTTTNGATARANALTSETVVRLVTTDGVPALTGGQPAEPAWDRRRSGTGAFLVEAPPGRPSTGRRSCARFD
jgi:hypothetical protein